MEWITAAKFYILQDVVGIVEVQIVNIFIITEHGAIEFYSPLVIIRILHGIQLPDTFCQRIKVIHKTTAFVF